MSNQAKPFTISLRDHEIDLLDRVVEHYKKQYPSMNWSRSSLIRKWISDSARLLGSSSECGGEA